MKMALRPTLLHNKKAIAFSKALDNLHQHVQRLQKKVEELEEFSQGVHMFIKDDHIKQVTLKAVKQQEERREKEATVQGLKERRVQLVQKQQRLQQQVQRHGRYGDFLEEVVKMTKFEDTQSFMDHVENLLHLREQLSEKEKSAQKDVDNRKKALQTLEDQHHLTSLHMNVQLSRLHRELDEMCSETLTWESKWNHLLEASAKKTLMLVQTKLVSLNLYELIKDKIEEEEFVDLAETEKQLDKVKMFVHDYSLAWTKLLREQNGIKKATK
ncbi:coiled-coil domain-containing protein 42 isoform X2 [Takifugu rubripes]|uniref:coiled-coil domain-containing protein 42 isoform X2 n=1 Tax=Takifugu rubripes TaxID=31033 RepID=UPI001145D177|nr:cilia- and flagella-associated protein 73 isoform X2 [Takifugu rubripes]